MGKKLLVVVDFQKDFVDGSLGFPKAVVLEDAIYNKIVEYKEKGEEVIFTYDTHHEEYLSTQEGRKLPVEHCIKGTEGWELYGRINSLKAQEDVCFEKVTFGSLDLANYLKGKAYDSIELVGLVSNICVISNGVLAKSAVPEAEIIVDANCTASFDDSMNDKVLDVMEGLQFRVVNR